MTPSERSNVSRRSLIAGAALGAAALLSKQAVAAETPAAATPLTPTAPGGPLPELARWDVRRFGARGDGKAKDTAAIQAAIDACAAAGGGTVVLSGGTFLSGTIQLASHITLWIDAGATLLGSLDIEDYPSLPTKLLFLYRDKFTKSLIRAERVENITLAGRGVINGQGDHANFKARSGDDGLRPYLLRFAECRNVRVRDLTMLNSARWLSHYLACEDVAIDGVTIRARIRENRDGMDIDSCNRVRISNCDIFAGDDAIVLKSTAPRPCRHVTVTNCNLSSAASALKLGTESNGGFEDITFSNCTIYDTKGSGIAVELVDGGACRRVNVSNIVMRDVTVPIFVRLGNRARPIPTLPPPAMGSMRDVTITNVQADGAGDLGCSITGIPGFAVENVTVQNVRIRFAGGGKAEDVARKVPEKVDSYPSEKMFGRLPAYGFYCRHARGLRLEGIDVALDADDARPAFVLDDVREAVLADCTADTTAATPCLVLAKQCDRLTISGWRPAATAAALVRAEGDATNITIMGNDFSQLTKIVDKGPEVSDAAVALVGNRMPAPAKA